MTTHNGREKSVPQAIHNSRYNPYGAGAEHEVSVQYTRQPPYYVPPPSQQPGPITLALQHYLDQEEMRKHRAPVLHQPTPHPQQTLHEVTELTKEVQLLSNSVLALEIKLEESEKSRELQRKFSTNMANVLSQEVNRLTQENLNYARRIERIETVLKSNEKLRK